MAFLVEETLGNFDFRILRVSISPGTKFQRNRLVLIRAQAAEGSRCLSHLLHANCMVRVGLGLLILA